MDLFPLSSLATLLALATFFWTTILVARARKAYGVKVPATFGHEIFDRVFRVQMNTMEQIILMLPVLWLCALRVGDLYGGIGGLVWSIGRVLYARGYVEEPGKREIGFFITVTPTFLMFGAVLVAIVLKLI